MDSKKPWHALSIEKCLKELHVEKEQGLSEDAVEERREEFGPNRLEEISKKPWWKILISQLHSNVIYLLSAACLLAFLSYRLPEGFAILAVIIINVAISFFSEWRAVLSMTALLSQEKQSVRVRRKGNEIAISDANLVPGDIVLIEKGLIPADMRILKADHLRTNEASLTGEFAPVDKKEKEVDEKRNLTERNNMLYKGTAVVEGSGEAVVVATGNDTELGRVAQLAEQAEKSAAPLQERLNRLSKILGWITIGVALSIVLLGLLIRLQEAKQIIETALAMGVAAIPEGLPIAATIALAHGMYLMSKQNAIVNRLMAVETLGTTNIIFSDKTGTLTENRMHLSEILTANGTEEFPNEISEKGIKLIEIGVYCTTANLEEEKGDPTEIALLEAGKTIDIDRQRLIDKHPQVRIEKFDPRIKMMATVHKNDGRFFVAVKGAPEAVIDAATCINGKEMDAEKKEEWEKKAEKLAAKGLRILAIAEKSIENPEENPYKELNLVGFVCFEDPVRRGVKEAIDTCQEAGIKVIMVTGDQLETAKAIAKDAGLVGEAEDPETKAMTGEELKEEEEFNEKKIKKILETNIFARVSPKAKLSLIKIYQEHGKVVAMTGDGINDAPALKKADIGIAMGIRGTQAAKQVADIVLKDDEFKTIVTAVKQGRVIFQNIRKSIMFMLCTNIAEVITISLAIFLG